MATSEKLSLVFFLTSWEKKSVSFVTSATVLIIKDSEIVSILENAKVGLCEIHIVK